MADNDTPSEDAGLRTVLAFSSSANPYASHPPERFIQAMRNSGYSILLGKYDEARVGKPEDGQGDDGVPYKVFPIKVEASNSGKSLRKASISFRMWRAGEKLTNKLSERLRGRETPPRVLS